MGGKAVHGYGVRRRLIEEPIIQPVGGKLLNTVRRRFGVIAHAHPDVGVDGVGALHGRARVVGQDRFRDWLLQRISRRRGDPHLHARLRPHDRQRTGNVVAIADVGEFQPLQPAELLSQREQVGQRLAGMILCGEHVDDRDGGVGSELRHELVRSGCRSPPRGATARTPYRGLTRPGSAEGPRSEAPSDAPRARRSRPRRTLGSV